MALSSVSGSCLILEEGLAKEANVHIPKHSKWKKWAHPSKTLRSLSLLTKKPGISHFLLNLADFVRHTLKGALHDKFHYLSFAQDIWQNYIFFPDPVNQTLL